MHGICLYPNLGQSWQLVSMVTLVSVTCCFEFFLFKLIVTFKWLQSILAISFCGHHSERG